MTSDERRRLIAELTAEQQAADDPVLASGASVGTPAAVLMRQFMGWLKRREPSRGDGPLTRHENMLLHTWLGWSIVDALQRMGLGATPSAFTVDDLVVVLQELEDGPPS